MLADHLCAERGTLVRTAARELVEWDLRPGRPDNHLLDAVVGAACAASIEGVTLAGQQGPERRRVAATPEDAARKRLEFQRNRGY
jgi:phage terminase large subunit GpA-like protein